ncbi:hypothetical protein [Arthrobacter woluwensis]|uniref:hypothetical protein n=1 Tax=Arthrobacter woluwensis TaxID=156980 RepID=UPI0011A43D1B|nr:hypothetical protein [Arthrobacter woluwensis]
MARRKDPRPFIAVHDDIVNHPKIEALSDPAFRHLIRLWGYANKFKTDGIITELKAKEKGLKVFKELTTAAWPGAEPLLKPLGDGRWECHDYLRHNRSAAELQELAEANETKKSTSGKVGMHKRWHVDRGVVSPDCELCDPDNG